MDDDELVAVTLTRREWMAVQEALYEYHSNEMQRPPSGLRPSTKERDATHQEWLLANLPRLDHELHRQVGVGPIWFG